MESLLKLFALIVGISLITAQLAVADAPPFVSGSWTLVILPDTQYYSQSYPAIFTSQTQWVRNNAATRNIKYVVHEGDVTNSNSDAHWQNAVTSMSLLDGAVPYAIVPGNHDVSGNRVSQLSERFLSRARSMPTFGDTYEHVATPPNYSNSNDDLNNSYHLFSAGGHEWIIICLEWAPRDAVLGWANQLLDTYSNRTAMIVTHAYLNNDNTRYDWWLKGSSQAYNPHGYDSGQLLGGVNDGEEMWRNLIDTCDSSYPDTCASPHPPCDPSDPHNVWLCCDPAKPSYLHPHENVLFMFNGHVLGDGAGRLTSTTGRGNQVHQMLANYQDPIQPNGGNGYLRLLEFRPDGTVQVYTYSPYLNASLTDSQQQFTLPSPVPAAASNPGAINRTPTSIRFTWQDNSNNETGFKVYYDTGSGEPATLRATTAANTTSYDAAGLSSGSQYSFQVQAISGNFEGAKSSVFVTETIDGTPPTTACDPVSGVYDGSVVVSLTANEPATIYYTTDGSEPSTSSSVYSAPIGRASDTTLRFYAVDTAGNIESPKHSVAYWVLSSSGRIADAKGLNTNDAVRLGAKHLHRRSGTFGYIEEADRASGVRVEGDASTGLPMISEGSVVSLVGTLQRPTGSECYVLLEAITASDSFDLRPLGVNGSGWRSPLLTGLCVKAWGAVETGSVTANGFLLSNGIAGAALRVITDGAPGVSDGQFVTVTGAMGFDGAPVVYAR